MVAATMGFLLQGIEIREMKAVFSPHITLGTASGSHRTTAQTPPQEHDRSGGDFMEG
jgi:2'-5' RNA ligase